MTTNKALGFALLAVFAMGAMASSAMAAPTIEFANANANLMAEQKAGTNDVLTVDGSNVTCNNMTYNSNGATAKGATNIELHPEYAGCVAFGFIGANVDTTNCIYRYMANGTQTAMTYSGGEIEIVCGANPIKINAGSGTCVATVGSQTVSKGIDFRDTTASENGDGFTDFDIVLTNSAMSVTKNVDGFGCPFSGTGATSATYNGVTTFTCNNVTNGARINCGFAPPEPTPTVEIAGGYAATFMGEQAPGTNDVLTVDGSNVTCNTVTYKANSETGNGSTNVELHPEYGGCVAFGFTGASITTTNCNFRSMARGTETTMVWSGELQIACGETPITINAGSGTCVATVGSQTMSSNINLSNMTVSNMENENGGSITLEATNASVAVTKNVDGFGCPFNGKGATTGTYNGTTTFRCTRPAEPTQYKSCTIKD